MGWVVMAAMELLRTTNTKLEVLSLGCDNFYCLEFWGLTVGECFTWSWAVSVKWIKSSYLSLATNNIGSSGRDQWNTGINCCFGRFLKY